MSTTIAKNIRLLAERTILPGLRFGLGRSLRPPRIAVNVSETDHEILLSADIPGIEVENISFVVKGNTLTFSGVVVSDEKEDDDRKLVCFERASGEFSRRIVLPAMVIENSINVSAKNGVVFVELRKEPRSGSRKTFASESEKE